MSNVPPVYGLYTAAMGPILYFVFGTSPYCNIGPYAVTSIMAGGMAVEAAMILSPDEGDWLVTSFATETNLWDVYPSLVGINTHLAFMSGCIIILVVTTRLSIFLDAIMPPLFIAGFTSGSSFSIFTSQIKTAIGVKIPYISGYCSNLVTWLYILRNFLTLNLMTLSIFSASLLSILYFPAIEVYVIKSAYGLLRKRPQERISLADNEMTATGAYDSTGNVVSDGQPDTIESETPKSKLPNILIVVIFWTILSNMFGLSDLFDVSVINGIQQGFPEFKLPWDLQYDASVIVPQVDFLSLTVLLLPSAAQIALVSLVTVISVVKTYPSGPIVDDPPQSTVEYTADTNNDPATVSASPNSTSINEQKSFSVNESQELVALGLCQIMASFFSCTISTSGLSRAAVLAEKTQARSMIAAFVPSIVMLAVITILSFLFVGIPMCVLAAVILAAISGPLSKSKLGVELVNKSIKATHDLLAMQRKNRAGQNEEHQQISGTEQDEDESPTSVDQLRSPHSSPQSSAPETSKSFIFMFLNIWEDTVLWLIGFFVTAFIDVSLGIFCGVSCAILLKFIRWVSKQMG